MIGFLFFETILACMVMDFLRGFGKFFPFLENDAAISEIKEFNKKNSWVFSFFFSKI